VRKAKTMGQSHKTRNREPNSSTSSSLRRVHKASAKNAKKTRKERRAQHACGERAERLGGLDWTEVKCADKKSSKIGRRRRW